MIAGDPKTALTEPNSIVLTKSFSNKFFGEEITIGKIIKNEDRSLKVTGLIEYVPQNSHLRFSGLILWNTIEKRRESWGNFGLFTYVKLKPGTDPLAFDEKISEMYDKYMAEIFEQYGVFIDYELQPITKIHLFPVDLFDFGARGL